MDVELIKKNKKLFQDDLARRFSILSGLGPVIHRHTERERERESKSRDILCYREKKKERKKN